VETPRVEYTHHGMRDACEVCVCVASGFPPSASNTRNVNHNHVAVYKLLVHNKLRKLAPRD
jgi:hypothetical protein